MESIIQKIKEGEKVTEIFFGDSLGKEILDHLNSSGQGKNIAVITDDNLMRIYGKTFLNSLNSLKPKPLIIPITHGEGSKSRLQKEKIEDMFLENNFSRSSLIVGFGGGVVTDLAGFVASTFARGIPLIQIPTTVLAMSDAAIGGKTGVNTTKGKNQIGSFYQPDAIFIGTDFLDSLPAEEYLNGLAEIVKLACALDKDFFNDIEKNQKKILGRDKKTIASIIKRNVLLKKNIVEKDPKEEKGERQILNFGHTVGHALETLSSYELKHGFCVSIGMAVESEVAFFEGSLKNEAKVRLIRLLTDLGLPTKIKKGLGSSAIISKMVYDKKNIGKTPRFILLEDIGKVKSASGKYSFEVKEDIIKKAIERCQDD